MRNRRTVPPRALLLSLASLVVPIVYGLMAPEDAGQYELLVWMTPLLPALLLSYYRGWRGAALALAGGMAALALAQVVAVALQRQANTWPLLLAIVTVYVALTLGIGFVAEMLHRAREEAERLALTDELTGLPNRRFARAFLEREFAAGQRGRRVAVVIFDLDRFKSYNDTYGHPAGDGALRAFARALETCTRKMNLSCRWGGEEFLSVVSSSDVPGALVFAERVIEQLAAQQLPAGHLTVSAGVAPFVQGMRSVDDLLAAADEALYRAKRDGRNCVRVASPGEGVLELSAPGAPPRLDADVAQEAGGH